MIEACKRSPSSEIRQPKDIEVHMQGQPSLDLTASETEAHCSDMFLTRICEQHETSPINAPAHRKGGSTLLEDDSSS